MPTQQVATARRRRSTRHSSSSSRWDNNCTATPACMARAANWACMTVAHAVYVEHQYNTSSAIHMVVSPPKPQRLLPPTHAHRASSAATTAHAWLHWLGVGRMIMAVVAWGMGVISGMPCIHPVMYSWPYFPGLNPPPRSS
jgi:hypothetical protein